MATATEISELNRKVNIPVILTKLGADPHSIRKLRGNDYRCPCWVRGGDNSHGMGITYHAIREKWLLTDFTHHTFTNMDLIDFAIKFGGYSFMSAIKLMEECIGVELDDADTTYATEYEPEYRTIHPSVLQLFEFGLHPYLHERGYSPEVAKHFGLGYSAIGELIDRITIPVVDETGQLVAIQGRTFIDATPKYIYLDGSGGQAKETLYNMYQCYNTIKEKGYVIVVEGAPSVWRAFDYGITNVVATLSTSVTDKQLQLLRMMNVKIILAFDHDDETHAGQIATQKVAERLKALNYQKGVYTFDIGSLGLSGAIDDLTHRQTLMALKTIKKLF